MSHETNNPERTGFDNTEIGYMRSLTDTVHMMYRGIESEDSIADWHHRVSKVVDTDYEGIRQYREHGYGSDASEAAFISEALGIGVSVRETQNRLAEAFDKNPALSAEQKQVIKTMSGEALLIDPGHDGDNGIRRQRLTDQASDKLIEYRRGRELDAAPDAYEVCLFAFAAGLNAASESAADFYGQYESVMVRYEPSTQQ